MKGAAVSTVLGSFTVLVRLMSVPSELLTGILAIPTFGAAFVTIMFVVVAVPVVAPPLGVTLRLTA